MSLKNKRILIVGGSSGIGFAVAKAAHADGAQIVIASSKLPNVTAAVTQLGQGATGVVMNVTDEKSVESACASLGAIDHLVFTAGDWGAARRSALADIDLGRANAVFAVRFWGALSVAKHAERLLSQGGSITLTDGLIAHRPAKNSALSTAMAGAIEHLARGLAVELAPLRVNAVCPGVVRTQVWNSIPEEHRAEQLRQMTQRQPLPRAGEPDEVAQAYLYLMRAGYTTGQVLHVDGGWSVV
jgi:NAD(P)-dependent dehydrogenase (short-subunit alcohol dehydrogenase family)